MNHTLFSKSIAWWGRPAVAVLTLLAASAWYGGCADPRDEPLRSPERGHTETVILWQNAESDGNVISATFNVRDELAPVGTAADAPARLIVTAFIRPDCQILRREQIMDVSIPAARDDAILPSLIRLDSVRQTIDSLGEARLDSIERIQNAFIDSALARVDSSQFETSFGNMPCDTPLYRFLHDPASPFPAHWLAARDSMLNLLPPIARELEDRVLGARIDTTVMGAERDVLGRILDNRFQLTLWLDGDTTGATPFAVYAAPDMMVSGQNIYQAVTDPITGYKGRTFRIDLSQFEVADPVNPNITREVNWTTCFPGSTRPCLSPGNHTLHARVTGGDTMVSGTLVLVYERPLP